MGEAESFAKDHPRAYASRLARLERIRTDFARTRHSLPPAGARLYEQVGEQLRALTPEAEGAATAELERRRARADAALQADKLGEALAAVAGFPKELAIASVAPRARQLEAQTRRRAVQRFQALDGKGRKLLDGGALTAARGVYAALARCGLPEAEARAKQALGEIGRLLAARDDKAARVAREAYPLTAKAVLDRLADRRYDEARKLLDAAIVEPQLAPERERLRTLQPLVRAAAEIWGHVLGGLKRLKPGRPVRAGGVGGTFVGYRDGRIHLQAGSVTMARPLAELRAAEAVTLAQASLGAPKPAHGVKLALFLLAGRDYGGARARLAAAEAQGADVAAAADLLQRFAPHTCARCKGDGTLPCPACGGKGYKGAERRPCDACNGQGKFECPKCHGLGSFTCPICKGTGQEFNGLRCAHCGGRGKIRCSRCKGTGEIKCKKCHGTGTLARPVACERCKGNKTIPCPECGGRGSFAAPDLVSPSARK